MTSSGINIVFLTDVHIGNRRVPASRIYDNIHRYVVPKLTDDTDLLILGGDTFDSLMHLDNSASLYVLRLILDLLALATQHQFLIRVLQGTFQHDRYQNRSFLANNYTDKEINGDKLIRVIETMDVECLSSGVTLLYLPGDLPYDTMLENATKLVSTLPKKKADIVVHHGYCDHQLPKCVHIDRTNVLTRQQFLTLTDGVVLSGHVHTPSIFHEIISGGSFERLCHGEEEPKGFFTLTMDLKKHKVVPTFVENESTIPFITIDLSSFEDATQKAIDVFMERAADVIRATPEPSPIYLRAIAKHPDILTAIRTRVMDMPRIVITTERNRRPLTDIDPASITSAVEFPTISPTQLCTLLFDKTDDFVTMNDIEFLTSKPERR